MAPVAVSAALNTSHFDNSSTPTCGAIHPCGSRVFMSGHSKWSTIKRKKGAIDAKRGKIFTKLVREITTAVRTSGGPDPDGNPRLRSAIVAARAGRMPNDTIERAIKKGAGDAQGASIEEINYEGYGAGGVAVFIEAQTDNRNRTSADVRAAFNKYEGNLGQSGSVAWMFHKVGLLSFDADAFSEDELMEAALEGGADDVEAEDGLFHVRTAPNDFVQVADHFEKLNMTFMTAELTMLPENSIKVEGKTAERVLKLIERLEDLDDVQKVYANFDIAEDELERIANNIE